MNVCFALRASVDGEDRAPQLAVVFVGTLDQKGTLTV